MIARAPSACPRARAESGDEMLVTNEDEIKAGEDISMEEVLGVGWNKPAQSVSGYKVKGLAPRLVKRQNTLFLMDKEIALARYLYGHECFWCGGGNRDDCQCDTTTYSDWFAAQQKDDPNFATSEQDEEIDEYQKKVDTCWCCGQWEYECQGNDPNFATCKQDELINEAQRREL